MMKPRSTQDFFLKKKNEMEVLLRVNGVVADGRFAIGERERKTMMEVAKKKKKICGNDSNEI
jgi:hypothetical protein